MKKETKVFTALLFFGGGFILGIKYIFPMVAPFIWGIIFACLIEPLVLTLENKLRIKREMAILIVLSSLMVLIFSICGITVLVIYQESQQLLPRIPELVTRFSESGMEILKKIQNLHPYLREYFSNFSLYPESMGHILRSVIYGVLNFLPRFPQAIVSIVLGGITAFFFSRDKDKISRMFFRIIPERWHNLCSRLKFEVINSLARFIRTEFILVLITSILTTLCFKLLGVSGAVAYGFIAGLLDVIPVLGPGLVYFPIVGVQLLFGRYQMALMITGCYCLMIFLRQIAEIKLFGEELNFHPLLTLFVLYAGAKIFGVAGVFLGPLLMITLRGYYRALNY